MKPLKLVAESVGVEGVGQLDRANCVGTCVFGVAERELRGGHAGEALGLVAYAEWAERVDCLLEVGHGALVVAEVQVAAAGLGVQLALT